MAEIKIDLKDANHLIGFGVPLPIEVKKLRHIKKFTTHRAEELKDYAEGNIHAGQKTAVLVGDKPEHEIGAKIMDDHYERLMIGERTLINTAELVGRNLIRNILNYSHLPFITDFNHPLKGVPAFIVYSGPSIDKNIELLSKCRKYGVVFASNTPVGACVAAGFQPDVLCCLESRDVSNTLGLAKPSVYVCDMSAHENNWKIETEHIIRAYQPDLAYLRYTLDAGTIPLGNGGFVGSTMIMLAYLWGADPIVLLGFDLALTDNRVCGSNMRYSGVTCEYSEDGLWVKYGGKNNTHNRSFLTQVKAWDGISAVKTTYERIGYIDWMKKFARDASGVELINATEGGAYLDGWGHKTLKETIKNSMWHAKIHGHKSDLMHQCEKHGHENRRDRYGNMIIKRIEKCCNNIIALNDVHTPKAEMEIRRLSREEPVLYTMLAPQFVQLRTQRPDEHTRITKIREIFIETAEKMLEYITGL